MRNVLALCMLTMGCASTAHPKASAPAQKFKIDLGYLDEPRVQEQVAAREIYRKKVVVLARSFYRTMERAQALDYAAKIISTRLTEEIAMRCGSSGMVLRAWFLQLPGTMKYASEKAEDFSARVERGGFGLTDPAIEQEFESVRKAIERAEADVSSAEHHMRNFCSCIGAKFSVQNGRGEIIFRTDGTQIDI